MYDYLKQCRSRPSRDSEWRQAFVRGQRVQKVLSFICLLNFQFIPNDHNLSYCEQLRHLDTRHFVIIECRHLAKGCGLKCGCIGWMLFRNLSCLGTIICSIKLILYELFRYRHAQFVTPRLQLCKLCHH